MKAHRLFALLFVLPLLALPASEPNKPNIILIYSDDHGYADLGAQGVDQHIHTPNLDALARDGVRFSRGYVSAPQCVPSRAGVITGRYQTRFGVEVNGDQPLPLEEVTIAERLKPAGYISCQIGKWHLEDSGKREEVRNDRKTNHTFYPLNQGFDEYYTGAMNNFLASHTLEGKRLPGPQMLSDRRFRCVWQADAAISFVERHKSSPFFLYLAFYAPHAPLESPEPWFSMTSVDLPLQRRQALAMIAAMDDGVGRLRVKLHDLGIERNTLIFFIGDNGAPLTRNAWNGSLNLPLVGEKGMLTDGGIRTPFLAAWPGTIPTGKVYRKPVSSLDVAATANALAGLGADPQLDGTNLIPYLLGKNSEAPHESLFWRWRSQAAILKNNWKLIMLGDQRFLFDIDSPEGENKDRLGEQPELAAELEKKLLAWDATMLPPRLPRVVAAQDKNFYEAHVLKITSPGAK